MKELPSKFNKLTEEVKGLKKQVHNLEIELPRELKEIPTKLEGFTKTVTSLTSQVAELKTLQWELPAEFLLAIASKKTEDDSVPLAGQAGTQPAEGEKNTNKATISQLFQRKATKNANLTKQQSKPTPPPTKLIIPPIITTTTTQMQYPFLQSLPKSSSQPEGEHIKKDKGKKALSLILSSKIEEKAKAKVAKRESEVRKEELVDLLGLKVVNKYYNDKLQYDRYCDKMLNRREELRITNYDDPLDKLNDLANKKRKQVDDIHDYFKANKRLKSLVQYEDHLAGTVLNKLVLSPGMDDHARTFNSLLLAEIDKRNLNPLKQIRVIEQLRQ
ncbi:hypothetical protein Tco_0434708 [Tanacetum coccineum]